MSTNSNTISNSDLNEPPVVGSRSRANLAASPMTAPTTLGHHSSVDPTTPNLHHDGGVDDHTPVGVDDIATPPTQNISRLSVSVRRTLHVEDQGESDEPKVSHRLAASGHIGSDVNRPTRSSAAIREPVHRFVQAEADSHTEGVERSPDSDPFEFDDQVHTQSPVATQGPVDHSDHSEANDQNGVVQQPFPSGQSISRSDLSVNATMVDPDPDYSQQSSTPVQPEFTGSLTPNPTTFNPEEDVVPTAAQRCSTSDRSETNGSLTVNSTTVDPSSISSPSPPAEFTIDQFDPIVQALADLSPPFTFDGDIVMPDDQDLKLFIWEKGYLPSFSPKRQPAVSKNKHAKPAKVPDLDNSREWSHDFRPKDHKSQRQAPLSWNSVVKMKSIGLASGGSSQKAFREINFDQFALKPDILAESDIVDVIKERLKQTGHVSIDTSDATLRVCTVGAWYGTDVSAESAHGRRLGTVVLGLPVMSEKGDIVVRKTVTSDLSGEKFDRSEKVIFDWAKKWMSQDPADVRPRWMLFPSGTRYAIEDTHAHERHGNARTDAHFVIEYAVYVTDDVQGSEQPDLTKRLVLLLESLESIIESADQDFDISFVLSRPADKLGDGFLEQLEHDLGQPHSVQPDAILYKAIKYIGLAPTFEHVNGGPINPVDDVYPRIEPTTNARFPVRVRDEAKRVISLSYEKSKPVVLIGAPILDDAENVGGRVIMTIEIPKAKDLIKAKGE